MYEPVYLREVDAGTENACWVVCAKYDPGAIAFIPQWAVEAASRPRQHHRVLDAE